MYLMFKPLFTSGSLFLKGVDILLENLFKLKENGTNAKTEMMAGITTFMTMAYILAVNPAILSASGMDSGAVFTATAIASCIGTLFMAFFANYPFALAPGMGLNAFFAYTVVGQMGYSWHWLPYLLKAFCFLSCRLQKCVKQFLTAYRFRLNMALPAV